MTTIKHEFKIFHTDLLNFAVSPLPGHCNITCYKDLLLKNGITTVIKLCENDYDYKLLEENNITVISFIIPDGNVPTIDNQSMV